MTGIGQLGSSDIKFVRKWKWTISGQVEEHTLSEHLVKLDSRPSLTIQEIQVDNLSFPGKQEWSPLTVTFIDTQEQDQERAQEIYHLIVGDDGFCPGRGEFTIKLHVGTASGGYNLIEEWTLKDACVSAVNWGELDFSSSEVPAIDMTIQYNEATYKDHTPKFSLEKEQVKPETKIERGEIELG